MQGPLTIYYPVPLTTTTPSTPKESKILIQDHCQDGRSNISMEGYQEMPMISQSKCSSPLVTTQCTASQVSVEHSVAQDQKKLSTLMERFPSYPSLGTDNTLWNCFLLKCGRFFMRLSFISKSTSPLRNCNGLHQSFSSQRASHWYPPFRIQFQ